MECDEYFSTFHYSIRNRAVVAPKASSNSQGFKGRLPKMCAQSHNTSVHSYTRSHVRTHTLNCHDVSCFSAVWSLVYWGRYWFRSVSLVGLHLPVLTHVRSTTYLLTAPNFYLIFSLNGFSPVIPLDCTADSLAVPTHMTWSNCAELHQYAITDCLAGLSGSTITCSVSGSSQSIR